MPKLTKFIKRLFILTPLLVVPLAIGLTTSQDVLVSEVKAQSVPAFHGAEGFGANTVGGRGGRVIEVTNLNDSGSGSLRACVETSGSRTCVFRTGGTIELSSGLTISNPYITIAGQTAPGGGITLKRRSGTSESFFSISREAHDVVIRYIRVRPGTFGGQPDGIGIYGNNVIVDHCSVSWAVDENMSTWYNPQNVTIQWSITSEGLYNSTHPKGPHSMGLLLGCAGSEKISIHHNLFAHNNQRNPKIATSGVVDCVNNVIYNFGEIASAVHSPDVEEGCSGEGLNRTNYVGNFLKRGRNSSTSKYGIDDFGGGTVSIYVKGNIGPYRPDESYPEENIVNPNGRQYITLTKHQTPLVTTTAAFEAYNQVLADAGTTIGLDSQGNSYLRRDTVDTRIVNDVRNGTGRIIDDPSQVGGWPVLASGIPYADSDHDGMADNWENNHFGNLSRGSASNSSGDYDGDGYTDLEEFLNGTNPKDGTPTSPTPSPSPTPTPGSPTPTPTPSPTPSPSPLIQGQLISSLVINDGDNASDWSIRDNLQVNDQHYGDRDYPLTSLPGFLLGSEWIRTAADSKMYTGSPVASFTAAEDITVYLAHNDEIASKPSWLQSSWIDTEEGLATIQLGNQVTFSLYRQSFSQGETVFLGPNGGSQTGPTMYTVIVQPGSSNPYDLSGDGRVNAADVLILLQNWKNDSRGDFNSDGKVNSLDFGLLLINWGT